MKQAEPAQPAEITERVLRFICEHRLLLRRQKLVVGVSGGPDSVCLLHILFELRKQLGIKLHIAHLDHQLRGEESAADARYVAELAQKLDIPATIEQRDVMAYKKQRRLSLEEAAREVRYSFLAEVTKSIGAERVAVGHTADDHIETILMHLVRGSGTRGLRGLQSLSIWHSRDHRLTVVRPLLEITREETADYCQHYRLMPCTDASNLSLSLLRNRIRLQLLPLLKSYNPQITQALLRTARIAADDLALIDKQVSRLASKLIRQEDNNLILSREKFLRLPSTLKRNLLRTAAETILGNLRDIEARHIEEMIDMLDKPAGRRISLPHGLTFAIEYDRYILGSEPDALSPFPILSGEYTLKIPGNTELPGWRVEAEIFKPGQAQEKDDLTAYFDFDRAGKELTVRTRRPGDRFQPLGMEQPKKLNEFMIDARIPRDWRRQIPVVRSPGQIIWVVGWRIDERVKVTQDTKQVLRLKFERLA